MSTAISARQYGDDYQAYQFWMYAAEMLRPSAQIAEIGFEVDDYKSFDDVAVKYSRPRIHAHGIDIEADYFQVKYSVNYGKPITAEALIDPKFSGAKSVSLLERLRDAVSAMPTGVSHRFVLVTSRPLDPRDTLSALVNTADGSINCEALFRSQRNNKRISSVRSAWATRLGLAHDLDLEPIIQRLRIVICPSNLQDIIADLNARLEAVGLLSWPESKRTNPYPALLRALCAEGKKWFTSTALREVAKREELLDATRVQPVAGVRLGIRTFMRWAENMEDESDAMLCLCKYFVDRDIKAPQLWRENVVPEVAGFLRNHIKSGCRYVLSLQTLTSIAFLVGFLIDPKLKAEIALLQIRRRTPWTLVPSLIKKANGGWSERFIALETNGGLGVAIGISRPILDDVASYTRDAALRLKGIVSLEPSAGPSQVAISDANEACALAEHAMIRITKIRKQSRIEGPLHVFISAPNVFSFLLGQLGRSLGDIVLYEYDFATGKTGAYKPSISVNSSLKL
jgi:hypothetical protein